MIRVLVIEDSLLMRTMIVDMLKNDPEIEVVGSASNGVQGLQLIEELDPDVVTLDIEMPRMNGLELLQSLQNDERNPRILMLSTLTEKGAEATRKAMALGADDFMLKPREVSRLRETQFELIAKIKSLVRIPLAAKNAKEMREAAESAVLIGSSAGGPPMLDHILSELWGRMEATLVITQHIPPGFTAPLAERLDRISPLPVKETENGEMLLKGHVYISRAGFHTLISGYIAEGNRMAAKVVHSRAPPLHAVRPAVDLTFSSAAQVFRERTLAIILSGMGNDGGEGALAVKRNGGRVVVCAEKDCLVYGMARTALGKGCVDSVLPMNRIPLEILRFSREGVMAHA